MPVLYGVGTSHDLFGYSLHRKSNPAVVLKFFWPPDQYPTNHSTTIWCIHQNPPFGRSYSDHLWRDVIPAALISAEKHCPAIKPASFFVSHLKIKEWRLQRYRIPRFAIHILALAMGAISVASRTNPARFSSVRCCETMKGIFRKGRKVKKKKNSDTRNEASLKTIPPSNDDIIPQTSGPMSPSRWVFFWVDSRCQ